MCLLGEEVFDAVGVPVVDDPEDVGLSDVVGVWVAGRLRALYFNDRTVAGVAGVLPGPVPLRTYVDDLAENRRVPEPMLLAVQSIGAAVQIPHVDQHPVAADDHSSPSGNVHPKFCIANAVCFLNGASAVSSSTFCAGSACNRR